ncbi:MAG: GNAT family N-acetyltransferase [Rhodothermales bacterium]|nr:GNAT family N-acetyltransferase [Rhodothermales bacterium]
MSLVWKVFDAEPEVLFIERGSDILAACTLFVRQTGPFSKAGLAPFLPFTPFIFRSEIRQTDVNQHRSVLDSVEVFLRQKYDQVRIHLPLSVADPRTFQWAGWSVSPLFTPVGFLPDCADVTTWSKGTAKLVEMHASQFDISNHKDNVAHVVRLVAESYSRNERTLPERPERMHELISELTDAGLALPYLARSRSSGASEAGVIALRDAGQACYWLAGSTKGPAMTVLIATLLNDLVASGCTSIDFVGANTATIAEFKRHFNTALRTYYACSITPSVGVSTIDLLRRLRRRG